MSWRYDNETGDIILEGWERGIAASPYQGCGAIQGANIYTETGEVMANFARVKKVKSLGISGASLTATSGQVNITFDFATQSLAALQAGTWIHITGGGQGNIANGYYYLIVADSSSPQNINIYTAYSNALGNAITPNFTGTLTFSTVDIGKPIHAAAQLRTQPDTYNYYILDSNGNLWCHLHDGTIDWVMLSVPGTDTVASPNGLATYGGLNVDKYIFIFYGNAIGYATAMSDAASTWGGVTTAWQALNYTSALTFFHTALKPRQKDGIYYCDGNYIGSFAQIPGQTFNPTSSTTYTFTAKALLLPFDETATCLAELNDSLIVGGVKNVLYVWDYGAVVANQPSGATMIFTPEAYTQKLLTVNNFVYIFPGSKGNIYVTNGSVVSPILTVPDYMAAFPTGSVIEPYFSAWGGVMFLRGRIYFSIQAANCGGIWSFVPIQGVFIQQDTGQSLRLEYQNSYATYSGLATVLLPPADTAAQNATGAQFWSGWDNGSSVYGIDKSGTAPYTGSDTTSAVASTTIVETDIVPVGSFIDKGNFTSVQTTYGAALVANEKVTLQYRTSNGAAWSSFGDSTSGVDNSTGSLGFRWPFPAANAILFQIRALLTSTSSSPSYVRLKNIRLTKTEG